MMNEQLNPAKDHRVALRLGGLGLCLAFVALLGLVCYDQIQFRDLFPEFIFAPLFAVAVVLLAFAWLRPKHAHILFPFFWIMLCIVAVFIAGAYTRHSLEVRLDQTIESVKQGQRTADLLGYPLNYERLQHDFIGKYQILMRGSEFGCSDFVVGFDNGAKYYIEFCPQDDNDPSVYIDTWQY